MSRNIALGAPTVGVEELEAVKRVFESGWLSGAGPACLALERDFAEIAGVPDVLATSNCGAALHLSLLALGVRPGDEIVVGDYTFPATGHAVRWAGATPVFVDVRPDIWSIDPALIESAITPRTVGIIAVDPFGQPADMDEILSIAREHGLWVVEDAACASGATYRGRPVGSLADATAFSFHGRKGITSGEGGALASTRPEVIERARKLHTYGIAPAITREASQDLPVPQFDELGHNYRLSDVQAAIMGVQVKRLPDLVDARARVAAQYETLLGNLSHVSLPTALPDRGHVWQSYVITIDRRLDRGRIIMALRERGVGCNIGTYASHLQPVYGPQRDLPVSADLFRRHVAIPMHANLTDEDVEYVAATVREVVTEIASATR